MPRYAANISLLFTELPFGERFAAAAEAGFEAVEILFPYAEPVQETKRELLRHGLTLVLINAPPPNYTGGTPGYAAVPGGQTRFQSDIRRVMRYAGELRPGLIHIMPGYCEGAEAFDTFVSNLKWAADTNPEQGFTIEPLNPGDQPGYFLNDYDLAARVLDAVDRPNVALQYDCYHAEVIHGDALAVWEKFKSRTRHIQFGDAPGRTEPGTGRINFESLIDSIDTSGYSGWVSAEYNPTTKRTENSLGWIGESRL